MKLASEPELIRTGFLFTEGPVWVAPHSSLLAGTGTHSGALVFSDIPAGRHYWLSGTECGIFREPTGHANGNALDATGALVSCEHGGRRVSRFDGVNAATTVTDRYEGKRLNSPNDVAIRSDGLVFFTDPPYGVDESDRELDFQGVFCVSVDTGKPTLLADHFDKPNGLAFSGDESSLFVADTERGRLSEFAVRRDGTLHNERRFCECERPDGMAIDVDGNVWVACMEGIEVFDATGRHLEAIPLPERPANIAFGDDDRATLYVCARTSVYALKTAVAGIRPGWPGASAEARRQ